MGVPCKTAVGLPRPVCTGLYGDVNEDGVVNSVDALFMVQFLAGTRTFTPCQEIKADVDGDGLITAVDAMFVANYTVGKQPYGKTGQPL